MPQTLCLSNIYNTNPLMLGSLTCYLFTAKLKTLLTTTLRNIPDINVESILICLALNKLRKTLKRVFQLLAWSHTNDAYYLSLY